MQILVKRKYGRSQLLRKIIDEIQGSCEPKATNGLVCSNQIFFEKTQSRFYRLRPQANHVCNLVCNSSKSPS